MEAYVYLKYNIIIRLISCAVLSWDVVIETLLETDFLVKNGNAEDGAAAAHLVR